MIACFEVPSYPALIAPRGIEIIQHSMNNQQQANALIAPRGIEMGISEVFILPLRALIAPRGIEIHSATYTLIRTI